MSSFLQHCFSTAFSTAAERSCVALTRELQTYKHRLQDAREEAAQQVSPVRTYEKYLKEPTTTPNRRWNDGTARSQGRSIAELKRMCVPFFISGDSANISSL